MKIIFKKGKILNYKHYNLTPNNTVSESILSEMIVPEFILLREYNKLHITKQILNMIDEINILYNQSCSYVSNDGDTLVSVVTPVEKIVQHLDEKKQRLEEYRQGAIKRLATLERVVGQYTAQDKQEVEDYFKHGHEQPDNHVIKRLRRTLFLKEQFKRDTKIAMFEMESKNSMKDEASQLRNKIRGIQYDGIRIM